MGEFRQIFTELSARDMIMAGHYSLTFLFLLWETFVFWQCLDDSAISHFCDLGQVAEKTQKKYKKSFNQWSR